MDDDALCEIEITEGRVCCVRLNVEIRDRDIEYWRDPKENAKHEALHLLLDKFKKMGKRLYTREDELMDEIENIVLILEKVIK